MRYLTTISILFVFSGSAWAQEMYIPEDAELTISEGAILTMGGGLINDGRVDVQESSEMIVLENLENNLFLINSGTISLFGDWSSIGTFNTSEGEMVFLGGREQNIFNRYLLLNELSVNKAGMVRFSGDSVKVTGDLNFIDGTLQMNGDGSFIVDRNAEINHSIGSVSYFDGMIISRGIRNRTFPVGDGNYYGKISLLDMIGISPEIAVSLQHQPPEAPIPGGDIIGVSSENVWQVDYRKGSIDSVQIQLDFIAEDLENFAISQNIRRNFDSPVIAYSDSSQAGPYQSLGVSMLTDTDSVSTGSITSQRYAQFDDYGSKYFAVALEPVIGPDGQIYFPNVFAPAATDARNQTYRVFGEHVANEPFKLEIYNRHSVLVYEANSFEEANTLGWDGINTKGKEEFSGVYYIYVQYAFNNDTENIRTYSGSIFLKR